MIFKKFLLFNFLVIYFCSAAAGQDKEHSNDENVKIIWIHRFEAKEVKSTSRLSDVGNEILREELVFLCEQLCEDKGLQIESDFSIQLRYKVGEDISKKLSEEVQIKDLPGGSIDYLIVTEYRRDDIAKSYTVTSTINEPVLGEDNIVIDLKKVKSCRKNLDYEIDNKGKIQFTEEPIRELAEKLAFQLKKIYDFGKIWFIYPKPVDFEFESELSEEYRNISQFILMQLNFLKKGGVEIVDSVTSANACLEVKLMKARDQVYITAIIKKPDYEHLAAAQTIFKESNYEKALDRIIKELSRKIP